MKARELAALLLRHPDLEVVVRDYDDPEEAFLIRGKPEVLPTDSADPYEADCDKEVLVLSFDFGNAIRVEDGR